MKTYVLRLKKGDDLKSSIIKFAEKNNIRSGYIATCVGSLDQLKIRKADGVSEFFEMNNFEILSLAGTIADNGVHLHISVSDKYLEGFGGHLLEGCKVNTTAEIVIVSLKDINLTREFDNETGYKELVIDYE